MTATPPTPAVSVGMPVYNGERYLCSTLDSLLDQHFTDFEIVVCDNCSTDRTADIVQKYAAHDERVRYFRNDTNIGLARNFNRAFALSRGRYFRWAMADDLVGPHNLADTVAVLDSEPETVLVVPGWNLIDEDDEPVRGEWLQGLERFSWSDHTPTRVREVTAMAVGRHSIAVLPYLSGLMRSEALWATDLLGSYPMSDGVLLAELALQGTFRELERPGLSIRLHAGSAGYGISTGDYARVWPTFHPGRPVLSSRLLFAWRVQVYLRHVQVLAQAATNRRERIVLPAGYLGAKARRALLR